MCNLSKTNDCLLQIDVVSRTPCMPTPSGHYSTCNVHMSTAGVLTCAAAAAAAAGPLVEMALPPPSSPTMPLVVGWHSPQRPSPSDSARRHRSAWHALPLVTRPTPCWGHGVARPGIGAGQRSRHRPSSAPPQPGSTLMAAHARNSPTHHSPRSSEGAPAGGRSPGPASSSGVGVAVSATVPATAASQKGSLRCSRPVAAITETVSVEGAPV